METLKGKGYLKKFYLFAHTLMRAFIHQTFVGDLLQG